MKKITMEKQVALATLLMAMFIFTGMITPVISAKAIVAEASQYSTYIGGTMGEDATKVTFDNYGNTILIGQTPSDDFPITDDAFQSEYGGGAWDGYIAIFNQVGELVFSSYIGGSNYEHVTTVKVDDDDNVILAGTTGSSDFPTTPDAYQSSFAGILDGFIMKVAPNGTLLYSTYFGGTGEDWIYGMEFDASGNYMFTGSTSSTGMATSGVVDTSLSGVTDAFIARLSADGSTKLMFSYIGGSDMERAPLLKIDSSYNYVLVGFIESDDYPVTPDAFQLTASPLGDAILSKISSDGTTMLYSTYLGGNDDDIGLSVTVDSEDNMIISGYTKSTNLSVVNAIQPTYSGGESDIFIAKFNSTGSIEFLTYWGGNETDKAWEVVTDPDDNIIVGGRSSSPDYPTNNGLNDTNSGSFDAIVSKISSDGQTCIASSYVGGSNTDIGEGLAVDKEGNVVVTGRTVSADFPITDGAYQEEIGGSSDSFVCHIAFNPPPASSTTSTDTTSTTITNSSGTGSGLFDSANLLVIGSVAIVVVIILVVILKRK